MIEASELDFDGLVNRLTQEVAQVHRRLATTQQKLLSTTRSLEIRTQELAESKAALDLLLAAMETSPDGLLAMGCFGRPLHFNSRFAAMWAIAEDKLDCLNDGALLALQLAQVKDPARFLEISRARTAKPGRERLDIVELADGRVYECQLLPQRLHGRRVGSVTRWRDVTETRRT